jgi:hypothetical protein
MYAIGNLLPVINDIHAWTAAINDTLAELQLAPGEHEDILIAAAELVGRLIGVETDGRAMSDDQTRQITDPIYYDDGKVIHACKSAIIDGGVRLVWTKGNVSV